MNPGNLIRSMSATSEGPCQELKQIESPSILDNLLRQRKSLEGKLDRVNAAIEALKANPEVSNVLELIAKANY